jgi:hypothetical protein
MNVWWPSTDQWIESVTGSDEIAVRDPLYVFAVDDFLTVTMTDEVNVLVNR